MSEILGKYRNGNYDVTIMSNGTKIRETEDDEFIPVFAENCDVTITNRCDGGCPWCYMGCTPNGKHADLLSQPWINTLHPYTELAINGNDLTHPQLIDFLRLLKEKKVIANLTVNQKHFMKNLKLLHKLTDEELIYGLGVSLEWPRPDFIEAVQKFPNAVIHTINGLLTAPEIAGLIYRKLKILILGYKELNRGGEFFTENKQSVLSNQFVLKKLLPTLIQNRKFEAISFDNLALEQLEVKKLLTEGQWEQFYMGDDGNYTFALDLVKKTFSKNSIDTIQHPILDNIDDMFAIIQGDNDEIR